jgi:hypothetical protein
MVGEASFQATMCYEMPSPPELRSPAQREGNRTVIRGEEILAQQYRWVELPQADGPGVYAYVLLNEGALPAIQIDPTGILYVGMTASSLDSRCHFNHVHSGFSTFRRSLGAILKRTLNLEAKPRSSGPSASNTQNFRFDEEGEARLTLWMRDNLRYAHVAVDEDVEQAEADLIRSLQPPLNLKG